MNTNEHVDAYIRSLPDWQQTICQHMRQLIHQAAPDIIEEIKFTNRPYFTLKGNVCAFLAAKDHVNIFIYDPMVPDPHHIINQGHGNSTARAIQIYRDQSVDSAAFMELVKAIIVNNQQGGWRKLQA